MASLKRISILFPILILAGCAGQGVSNPGMHLPEIRSDEARIFVKRQTGYVGSAALIEVKHNGSLISKLGEGESVSILGTIGDNTVSVNFTGLASIGVNSPVKIIKSMLCFPANILVIALAALTLPHPLQAKVIFTDS